MREQLIGSAVLARQRYLDLVAIITKDLPVTTLWAKRRQESLDRAADFTRAIEELRTEPAE